MGQLPGRLAEYHLKVLKVLLGISGALLLGIMFYLTGDVIGRYLLNSPLPASFSIAKTVLVLMGFLGFAYVQRTRGNIELEFLTKHFSPFWQGVVDIVSPLIGLVVFGLVFWGALGWSIETWKTKEFMDDIYAFPYWPSRFAMVLGAFFLSITYIIDIIERGYHLLTIKGSKGNG